VLPKIVTHPEPYLVKVGSSITLTCEATGTRDIIYQWKHDDKLNSDANDSSLVISPIMLDDGGVYHCEASNSRGEIAKSTPARVTVIGE